MFLYSTIMSSQSRKFWKSNLAMIFIVVIVVAVVVAAAAVIFIRLER